MTQWVRLWDDMATDPKWRVVAKRSGRPLSEVIAVFVFMMINAGVSEDRGVLTGWDDEDVAAALDLDGSTVASIRESMQGKTLDGDHLTGWEKRQPRREDPSADRVKAFRERQAEKKRDETICNAPVTQCNAPEEKREDKIDNLDSTKTNHLPVSASPKPARKARTEYPEPFEAFWSAYPTSPNMSKKVAFSQWQRLNPDDRQAAFDSLQKFNDFCRNKPDYPPVYAERYLSQRRFDGFNRAGPSIGNGLSNANAGRRFVPAI